MESPHVVEVRCFCLFPDPADQQRFRDSYIRKYKNRRPDVIVTVGPSPLRFMLEAHDKAFTGVPVVFCLPNWMPGAPFPNSEFTGVSNGVTSFETIQAALRLQPDTRRIVLVGGTSVPDTTYLNVVKEQIRPYERNFQVSYLTSLKMPDLVEQLKRLPNRTIVLYGSFSQDAAGTKFTSGEASAIVAAAANVPVFSLIDVDFGHGEVGGKLSSLREQGRIVGSMVGRILKGEKPQNIPRVNAGTVYMFDWRALKRWGSMRTTFPRAA